MALLLLGVGAAGGCAGAAPARRSETNPNAAEVSWSVCRITRTPSGMDVDDGGAEVSLVARGGQPERLVLGEFPAGCAIDRNASGSRLSCQDIHIDKAWVAAAVQGPDGAVSVEQLEYPVDDSRAIAGPPLSRKALGRVTFPAGAHVVFSAEMACAQ